MKVMGGEKKSLAEKYILRQIKEKEENNQSLDSTPSGSSGEWINDVVPSDGDASLSEDS